MPRGGRAYHSISSPRYWIRQLNSYHSPPVESGRRYSKRAHASLAEERIDSKKLSEVMRILFVCKSNAARSQMAEAFLNHFTHKHVAVSAGLRTAFRNKVGFPVPWQVAEKMEQIGIRMVRYRRKQLHRRMVKEVDRVIVIMTPGQIRAMLPKYLARSRKVTYWSDVKDPRNDLDRIRARDQIRAKVKRLVRDLG
jgi:protein-tyrosine-phosphatase